MKRIVFFSAMAAACAATAATVSCSSLKVKLDESQNGAMTRLVTAHGADLGPATGYTDLFHLKATRTDDFMRSVEVRSCDAVSFTVEKLDDGVKLIYDGFKQDAVRSVVCTVRGLRVA